MGVTILTGDCRKILREHAPFDLLIADPPYGDTSLAWDKRCEGWISQTQTLLKPTGSMWVFGSMRSMTDAWLQIHMYGWRYAQDIVWEKHNGSGLHADRFRRVHEHIVQFYRTDAAWADIFNEVQKTTDAVSVKRRTRGRPAHFGAAESGRFRASDDGTRLMRSVITMPNMNGRAIHPTEKPSDLIEILIRTSCPAGGLVGDLFAGSGAAGEAAMRAGRRYIGCELDPDMASSARARLSGLLPLESA